MTEQRELVKAKFTFIQGYYQTVFLVLAVFALEQSNTWNSVNITLRSTVLGHCVVSVCS